MPDPRSAHAGRLRGSRILVVEDDADIRRMVALVLEGAGARVDEAATGADAIRLLVGVAELNAVVLDWNLSDVPAGQVLDRALHTRPDLSARILVMTGDLIHRDAVHPAEERGLVLVRKPFRPRVLVEAIARPTTGEGGSSRG